MRINFRRKARIAFDCGSVTCRVSRHDGAAVEHVGTRMHLGNGIAITRKVVIRSPSRVDLLPLKVNQSEEKQKKIKTKKKLKN